MDLADSAEMIRQVRDAGHVGQIEIADVARGLQRIAPVYVSRRDAHSGSRQLVLGAPARAGEAARER